MRSLSQLRRVLLACMVLTCGLAPSAISQTTPQPVQALVLTIDMARLFNESQLGERLRLQVEERLAGLAAENREIETQLEIEELELTETRKTTPAEEFKVLADEFDAKVQAIRSEQDAKGRALQQVQEEERAKLLQQITPILAEIAQERGAIMVVERRSVVLAVDAIDVTDDGIRRIDAITGAPEN